MRPHAFDPTTPPSPKKTHNGHFILIPLPAIRGLIASDEALIEMTLLGIYISASKLKETQDHALEQFLRVLHESKEALGPTMLSWLKKMGRIDADREMEFLQEYASKHPDFGQQVTDWSRTVSMFEQLSFNFYSMQASCYDVGKGIMARHPEYAVEPMIALDRLVLKNMIGMMGRTTENLRARWAMYLGMLSIIGTKLMAQTTSIAIKSRMFGAKDAEALQTVLHDPVAQDLFDRWTTRRRYEGLLADIEIFNKVKSLGVGRRTYISYRYESNQDFAKAILKGSTLKQVAREKKQRRNMLNKLIKEEIREDKKELASL